PSEHALAESIGRIGTEIARTADGTIAQVPPVAGQAPVGDGSLVGRCHVNSRSYAAETCMIAATDDRKRDFDRFAVCGGAAHAHPEQSDDILGSAAARCVGRRYRALPIPTVAASTRARQR